MVYVFIASDHAGFVLKNMLVSFLQEKSYNIKDLGPEVFDVCDYPIYAKHVCDSVLAHSASFGILICGTGIGMSMASNRIKGIRSALCTCEFQAQLSRKHNNANVLCLGERVTGSGVALEIADIFLKTSFENGRHLRRINLFDQGM